MHPEKIVLPIGRALEALRVLDPIASMPHPVARSAYRIGRLLARLQMHPDIVAAEKTRQAAVRKVGVEKDGVTSVPPERLQEFTDDYGPVAATLAVFEVAKLPVSAFDGLSGVSGADMAALQDFLEDD